MFGDDLDRGSQSRREPRVRRYRVAVAGGVFAHMIGNDSIGVLSIALIFAAVRIQLTRVRVPAPVGSETCRNLSDDPSEKLT